MSVIIPIFNVADYLEECLDSVLAQTHKKIEVVCVNDGSTDDSLAIMRRYEEADSRVKVVDKPNGGYGHSVNRGLEAATGDWISIIEPDDFIDKYMYQDLLSNAHDKDGHLADIVKGSYWLYFDLKDGTPPYIETPNLTKCMPKSRTVFTVADSIEVMKHHPSIWSAIYRREFLDAFGIHMIEPPGAGWADNPWFFETLLQAQSVVWIPAGYYYYRQTNPNASSKLRDYHMPFERLRDIRGIYERLGITDKNLLKVLYQRSFNYTVTSVLNEFGFDESDPELQALIREVMESMDEDIILRDSKGIAPRFRDYYQDFMGITLSKVKPHGATPDPRLSIVLPLHNDRAGLWETLQSLMSQSFEDFEVLCYDCDSHDRSAQIVNDVSRIDQRFSLVPSDVTLIPDAMNASIELACGEWITFLRSGITYSSVDTLQQLLSRIDEQEKGFQGVLLAGTVSETPFASVGEGKATQVSVAKNYGRLMRCSALGAASKLFDRSWLAQSDARFGNTGTGDEDGHAFVIRAILAADKMLVVPKLRVSYGSHHDLVRQRFESEDEIVAFEKARIDAIAAVGREFQTEKAWKATRDTLLTYLNSALNFIGSYHAGRAYFNMLRDTYHDEELRLSDCSKANAGAYARRIRLDRTFWNTYDTFVELRYKTAIRERDAARRSLKITRNLRSFKLAKKAADGAKKVIPKRFLP